MINGTHSSKIEWPNTLFLTLTPLAAIATVVVFAMNDLFRWPTLVLAGIYLVLTGLAITGGYHRLFSHKTYEVHPVIKIVLLLFGAAAFQNSARRWSSDHRRHHKYVDTDRDPYNSKRGFFFSHMGWVMLKYHEEYNYDDVPDLMNDKWVMWQERHIFSLGVLVGLVLPALIASAWGDPWGGLLIAGLVRTVVNHHFTFLINSAAHIYGTQPYSDSDTSRDNWILALATYGEGYHNFHHKFPFDYRNGIRFWQWDPTKWTIRALAYAGLTSGLKVTPEIAILRARLAMDQKRLLAKLEKQSKLKTWINEEKIQAAREKLEHAFAHCRQLRLDYEKLKSQKLEVLNTQVHHFQARLHQVKLELSHSRVQLEEALNSWKTICQNLGVSPTRAVV